MNKMLATFLRKVNQMDSLWQFEYIMLGCEYHVDSDGVVAQKGDGCTAPALHLVRGWSYRNSEVAVLFLIKTRPTWLTCHLDLGTIMCPNLSQEPCVLQCYFLTHDLGTQPLWRIRF